ncbi:MAG: acyl carrier protein [Lachnospiraceae bacterium]|nr:acyl carrier protein [Lachnospiraceae bacterium]
MDKLLAILKEIHPDVDFEQCNKLIDDDILDSFDIVSLISEVADTYDVVIPAEYITRENFNSADAIYKVIRKLEEED